ncbi:hypothetical protein BCR44DRAFT_1084965 [Catenaria anguillulae PL171]|uniref:Uncharacterized protein n=1 Tax=Catenaria anguillulae PL171 TaxID=765915 RepID=A0A1Y2HQY1_9FUNG|nr:hypothetical protein BCR44DRAFT_1084965 [Catenaria anguillulae PL171]
MSPPPLHHGSARDSHTHSQIHVVEEESENRSQNAEKPQPAPSTTTSRFHTQARQPRPTSMIMAKSERRRSALPLATPTSRRESMFGHSSTQGSHWPQDNQSWITLVGCSRAQVPDKLRPAHFPAASRLLLRHLLLIQ